MKSSEHWGFLQPWVMASVLSRHTHLPRWSSPDPRDYLPSWEWCPDTGTGCIRQSIVGTCPHGERGPIQEFGEDRHREAGYPLDLASPDAPRNPGHLCRRTAHTYCGSVHRPGMTLGRRMASDHSGLSGLRRLSSAVHPKPDTHRELPSDSQRTGHHRQSEEYRILAENHHAGFALGLERLQTRLGSADRFPQGSWDSRTS